MAFAVGWIEGLLGLKELPNIHTDYRMWNHMCLVVGYVQFHGVRWVARRGVSAVLDPPLILTSIPHQVATVLGEDTISTILLATLTVSSSIDMESCG